MIPVLFGDGVVARAGPVPITETMVTSSAVSLFVIGLGGLLARAARTRRASRAAALARLTYRAMDRLVRETAGHHDPLVFGIATALFAFIAASAVAAMLPGLRAPTANVATAAALASVVFVAAPVLGVFRRGAGAYVREYLRPNPLFFPIHVLSELSRTLALALRLFGNMMSGHVVVALLVALVGVILPIPLMALHLLIGILQAYIFTVLACVYLGAALHTGESP